MSTSDVRLGPRETSSGSTLPVRIELLRQLRRRRTQITLGLFALLPVILWIAFSVGNDSSGQAGLSLTDLAQTSGPNFVIFALFSSASFLFVVVVALFFGDTVASEASWSSLRYLLAQPVPRSRLLRQKLAIAGAVSVAANVLLPLWAFVVGGVFFGWSPARSPIGGSFTSGASSWRLLIIVAYICGQLLVVAALAFLLSVSVDNPLGAVGGAVLLQILSNILDQITALGNLRNVLPTHYNDAWLGLLSNPMQTDDLVKGCVAAIAYATVFFGLAWWRFLRKDVVS